MNKTDLRHRSESPLVAPAHRGRGKHAWPYLTVFPWRHDRLPNREEVCLEAIVERRAGIDIGQATVAVTVLVGPAHLKPRKTTRRFGR